MKQTTFCAITRKASKTMAVLAIAGAIRTNAEAQPQDKSIAKLEIVVDNRAKAVPAPDVAMPTPDEVAMSVAIADLKEEFGEDYIPMDGTQLHYTYNPYDGMYA